MQVAYHSPKVWSVAVRDGSRTGYVARTPHVRPFVDASIVLVNRFFDGVGAIDSATFRRCWRHR